MMSPQEPDEAGVKAPALEREPVGTRLSLTAFARELASGRKLTPFHGALRRQRHTGEGPSQRLLFLRDAIRQMTLAWLCRSGGYRRRTVVVADARRVGRLWEPGIFEGLRLSFSPQAIETLLGAYEYGTAARRTLTLPPLLAAGLGDIVFRHLTLRALLRETSGELQGLRGESLDELDSPLTRLCFADRVDLQAPDLERLQAPDFALLLTFLDRCLACDWVRGERAARELPTVAGRPRLDRLARTLEAWITGARTRRCGELLLPVFEFFRRAHEGAGGRDRLVRDVQHRSESDLYSASERERYVHACGRVYKLGEMLQEHFEEIRSKPYLERNASDQVMMAGYHEVFQPVAADIRAIGRRLIGEIG